MGLLVLVFFQAEDGVRDLVRSRGLGDVYKRQEQGEGERSGNSGSGPERVGARGRLGTHAGSP